jgi:hypothetical protein
VLREKVDYHGIGERNRPHLLASDSLRVVENIRMGLFSLCALDRDVSNRFSHWISFAMVYLPFATKMWGKP